MTESIDTAPQAIDWLALARRLQAETAKLVHAENAPRLYGDDFYAEALRRTFGYRAPYGHLKHETVAESTGLMTVAYADHLRDGHTVIDRLNAEAAKKEAREAHEEARRVLRDSARDLAKLIRGWCNERTVPAKFRREGVLLAADWIDPDCPTSPYTQRS